MPHCPHCHQSVDTQAIACPHCQTLLKAHGHPGILLHRATGEAYLCQSCLYHLDDSCTFPQRPHARECTLYRDQTIASQQAKAPAYQPQRHYVWLILVGLVAIAVLLTL